MDNSDGYRCDICDITNPVWFAPNDVWNFVMGGPDALDDPGGMLCPHCFILRAEAAGVTPTAWILRPEAKIDHPNALSALNADLVEAIARAIYYSRVPKRDERTDAWASDAEWAVRVREAQRKDAAVAIATINAYFSQPTRLSRASEEKATNG